MSDFLKNKKITSNPGISLYTGVSNVNVVGVNPTKKELSEILGKDIERDITYTGTDDLGNPTLRLDFWLRCNDKITTGEEVDSHVKLAIFISGEVVKDQTGNKTKYINNKLSTSYGTSPEALPSWYDTSSIRECRKSEDQLLEFLSTLGRLDRRDEDFDANLKDYDAILKGDLSELKEIIEGTKENTIRVLLGVRVDDEDGKSYQRVYPNKFLYGGTGSVDRMSEAAESQYGGCNLEYNNSMELQLFSNDKTAETGTVDSATAKKETDDLPF